MEGAVRGIVASEERFTIKEGEEDDAAATAATAGGGGEDRSSIAVCSWEGVVELLSLDRPLPLFPPRLGRPLLL